MIHRPKLINSGARLVFGKLLPQIPYPVLWGVQKGNKYILGSLAGKGGGASVYFNMVEPEQTSRFAETIQKGMVFFDIGANVGYYTILAAQLTGSTGKVFSFEPMIRNVVFLYWHTILNRVKNVTILPVACSDRIALQAFSDGVNFATGHLIEGGGEKSWPVSTLSVDAVVRETGVSPDVIKIDVEGAELSVLKGASTTLLTSKPIIFLSTHSRSLREACVDYLGESGYVYEILSKDESNPSEFLFLHPGKQTGYGIPDASRQ